MKVVLPMRRLALFVCLAAAGSLAGPSPAGAARVVTWVTSSKFVDPAGPTPFNRPPGVAARPNALRVNIYLPDGYDGHRRFPVLWLLHGHGDAYDSWVNPKQGDLLHLARGFPGIVVMPEGAQGWYTDWWNGGHRTPGWESYYLLELMPLIERRLRILPGRAQHAIAGLSMGGEGSAFFAEQRPGYFGAMATFSGVLSIQRPEWPVGFNTQGQDYATVFGPADGFYATGHNPLDMVKNLEYTRVLIRVGDGTPAPSEVGNYFGSVAERELELHAMEFAHAASSAGADTTLKVHQGIHDWPYWRADLLAALKWGFFRPVNESPSKWSYTTVDQHAQAWGLRLDFRAPPTSVERFSRDGRRLSATGSGTVSITDAGGCRINASLPFALTLPARACRRSGYQHKVIAHRA